MKFIKLLFSTASVTLLISLSACGGSSGGDARTGDVKTCVWDVSTWDSGCVLAK